MGTLEFPEQKPECQAEALVFSGRPNPKWTVPKGVVKGLEKIWSSLEPAGPEMPPSGLGLSGFPPEVWTESGVARLRDNGHAKDGNQEGVSPGYGPKVRGDALGFCSPGGPAGL
jgi:hypothetical protein